MKNIVYYFYHMRNKICHQRHKTMMTAAIILLSVSSLSTNGCATLMVATAGPKAPNLEKIQVGASRQVIEDELGKPIANKFNVSVYEFNISDPPPWYA